MGLGPNYMELNLTQDDLTTFIDANKIDMLLELSDIVFYFTNHDLNHVDQDNEDLNHIDIRLCIDLDGPNGEGSWIFRTGDASYDQVHSQYCSASSVGVETKAAKLLSELLDQLQ